MAERERVQVPGLIAGFALAPLTALGSYVRGARLFHPRGTLLRGVAIADGSGPYAEVGARLSGPVLMRLSSGWWKSHEWRDVLGCALRFTHDAEPRTDAKIGDQDLLLATIRHPLTTLLAPLRTHASDFFDNDYFGVSPFVVPPLGRVKIRLAPVRAKYAGDTRQQRLDSALHSSRPLRVRLEMRADHIGAEYHPVALIDLIERVELDQEALHFDPFRTGRALEPVGFVHALRVASYAASRWARAQRARSNQSAGN